MKFLKSFVSAVLGGISVSLGSAAYLMVKDESILAASLLFSAGFLATAVFEFGLFTDKSGYLFERNNIENNVKRLLTTLLGNIAGALVTGIALFSKVNLPAKEVFAENLKGLNFSFLLSSIIAGVLIYIAMHGYRKAGGGFASCAILITASAIIPVCGLEYALCNVFTIGAALPSPDKYVEYILQILCIVFLSAIGNAIGAIVFASLCRFKDSTDEHHHHHKRHHRHHHEKTEDTNTSNEKAGA